MTVKELIAFLETMPPEAIVIHDMCSDYEEIDQEMFTLMEPKEGGGLVKHHGHLMEIRADWISQEREWDKGLRKYVRRKIDNPTFLTAVHLRGN